MKRWLRIAIAAAFALMAGTAAAGPVGSAIYWNNEYGAYLGSVGEGVGTWYNTSVPYQCEIVSFSYASESGGECDTFSANPYKLWYAFPEGQYELCLDVYDPDPADLVVCTDATATVTVVNRPPTIKNLEVFPLPAVVGYPLAETWIGGYDLDTVSCAVDFGDGSDVVDGTLPDDYTPPNYVCDFPAHTFTQAGTFTATFSATDADGATTTRQLDIPVVAQPYMWVYDLDLALRTSRRTATYTATVTVLGPMGPVSQARVVAEWKNAQGITVVTQYATTSREGIATVKSGGPGIVGVCVTNLVKKGWTYEADPPVCAYGGGPD